jgi:hypothetical protein
MSTPHNAADLVEGQNWQIPNNLLNAAFGELNVAKRSGSLEIALTILMEPQKEGSQTGVALDGSASMQSAFGYLAYFTDTCDSTIIARMQKEGKAKLVTRDEQEVLDWTEAGWSELVQLGYVKNTPNVVEPVSRDVIPYLAEKIDADGGTTVIYWACGAQGDAIEVIGDLTGVDARVANYAGPQNWGMGTKLLPAVKYFLDRFADADWGFYVFVTDGRLDDLDAVKQYTAQLSKDIGAKKRKPVKCVLIGVGSDVDESQMEQLDDLPDEMDLPVDIWDHKVAKEMRDLRDIFAEVVDENALVAPTGRVLDHTGAVAANYSDGMPSLLKFSLPVTATEFTVEVGPNRVTQKLFT